MVVSVCEEACARANKAMSRLDQTRESRSCVPCVIKKDTMADMSGREARMDFSTLRSFASSYGLLKMLVSNKAANPRPSKKSPCPPGNAATDEYDTVVETLERDIVQQVLSIRYRVRIALPDQDFLHPAVDASYALCFLLGVLICPLLIWVTLQSLKLEPPSLLDQRMLVSLPFFAKLIGILGRHSTMALTTMISLITTNTVTLVLTLRKTCPKGRSVILACSWCLVAAGSLLWTRMGGSIVGLFLVFIPFALGVGAVLGLLLHRRVSRVQRIPAVSKCRQDAASNEIGCPQ